MLCIKADYRDSQGRLPCFARQIAVIHKADRRDLQGRLPCFARQNAACFVTQIAVLCNTASFGIDGGINSGIDGGINIDIGGGINCGMAVGVNHVCFLLA